VAPGEIALHLAKDTGVRWNKTYLMIQRALRLQSVIQRYCREWHPANSDSYDLSNDFLDPQDWEELRHFEELLQPFERPQSVWKTMLTAAAMCPMGGYIYYGLSVCEAQEALQGGH
jgi:hypothetical protein